MSNFYISTPHRIKTFLFFTFLFLNGFNVSALTTYTSVGGTSWTTGANWSGGVAPGTAGGPNNVYLINNTMILTTAGFTLGANSVLSVCNTCTFTINGNVNFSNGSTISVPVGAKLIINGNVDNNNNSNQININGIFEVNGNFTGGNGSDITSSGGTGVMVITGTVATTGSGTVFGSPVDCSVPGACGSSAASPLPVELIDFTAKKELNKIYLSWSTASEINNDYFEVERSSNGEEFDPILKVKGAGTTSKINQYYEFDTQPNEGHSYYRLKQVDFDGKSRTYNPIKIKFNQSDKSPFITAYPNPVEAGSAANVDISGFAPSSNVLVVLRDLNGKEVYTKVVLTDVYGETYTALDIEQHLPAGIYIVVGSSDDKIFNHKLIIK